MRRLNYALKRTNLALIEDCLYYCWQYSQIDDDEYSNITNYLVSALKVDIERNKYNDKQNYRSY